MAKLASETGYAAVMTTSETVWPFRGVLHGSANLARRHLTKSTFPNKDHNAAWRSLREGGWRIAKVKISEC